MRRGVVWRCAGVLASENVSHVHVFARQDLDHRRRVRGLRGLAAGAVQRRDRRETTTTCTSAGCPRRRPPPRSRASPSCSTSCAARARSLVYAEEIDKVVQTCLPFFALLVALLMVSRIPYPHVVNQVLRGQRSFGHIVALVFAFVAIMSIHGLFGADHRLRVRAGLAHQVRLPAIASAPRNARPDLLATDNRSPAARRSSVPPPRAFDRSCSPDWFNAWASSSRLRDAAARQAAGHRLRRELADAAAGRQHRDQRLLPDRRRHDGRRLAFEAGPETLARTNLGELAAGRRGESRAVAARRRSPGRPFCHRARRGPGHARRAPRRARLVDVLVRFPAGAGPLHGRPRARSPSTA